jgi:hypothetical protein
MTETMYVIARCDSEGLGAIGPFPSESDAATYLQETKVEVDDLLDHAYYKIVQLEA